MPMNARSASKTRTEYSPVASTAARGKASVGNLVRARPSHGHRASTSAKIITNCMRNWMRRNARRAPKRQTENSAVALKAARGKASVGDLVRARPTHGKRASRSAKIQMAPKKGTPKKQKRTTSRISPKPTTKTPKSTTKSPNPSPNPNTKSPNPSPNPNTKSPNPNTKSPNPNTKSPKTKRSPLEPLPVDRPVDELY